MATQEPAVPPADPKAEANAIPDPALFVAKKGGKKRGRKKFEPKDVGLQVNSLADILSTILFFLIKSYSASTIQIKADKELQVPMSISERTPEESPSITITGKNILVDDKPCVNLETGGTVSNRDLAQGGMLVQPLFEELQSVVDHQKRLGQRNSKAEFKGMVTIIGDRFVKSPVVIQAMYTAGLAEFSKFQFVLVKTERK